MICLEWDGILYVIHMCICVQKGMGFCRHVGRRDGRLYIYVSRRGGYSVGM